MVYANELCHHGIRGQRWGIRRFRRKDGSLTEAGKEHARVIRKGSSLYRIDRDPDAPTYDGKRYVSTNEADNEKWKEYLGKGYGAYGEPVYSIAYKTTKDIKVAEAAEAGKLIVASIREDPSLMHCTMSDTTRALDMLYGNSTARPESVSPSEIASYNLAAQTETGRRVAKKLLQLGYGAVEDEHGRNVSDDPVIVFKPDRVMKKVSVENVDKYVRTS